MAKLILAIDDDKYIHHIIKESLAQYCKIIHAKEGDEGVRLATKYSPDIILLDIEMPGKSGYEVCQTLKLNASTQNIPIMFLSSKVELAERIKGYRVGGSDYITKPFNGEELMARIKVLYEYSQQNIKLKLDIKNANETANIAMTESGDMGRVIRFVGESFRTHDFQSLSEHFLAFFSPFNLDVVVAFWCQKSHLFYHLTRAVCPLEQELLAQQKNEQRFIDIGNSTIINYPKISILIKNMPLEDNALYGRYKDLFPHILDIANEKLVAMDVNQTNTLHAAQITEQLNDIMAQLSRENIAQNEITKQFVQQFKALQITLNAPQYTGNNALTSSFNNLSQTLALFLATNTNLLFLQQQLEDTVKNRDDLLLSLNAETTITDNIKIVHNSDIELF